VSVQTRVLHRDGLWDELARLGRTAVPKAVAVAYAGKGAEHLLQLRAGDVLVLDGSDRALASGVTHPAAVQAWLNAGAEVYSYEGLHAKVLVVGRTAVIGSANLSHHSRDHLWEAGVVTEELALVREARAVVKALLGDPRIVPLDDYWVEHAWKVYRQRPSSRKPSAPRMWGPRPGFTLWVYEAELRAETPAQAGARRYEHRRVRRALANTSDWDVQWERESRRLFDTREGDVVIRCMRSSQRKDAGAVRVPGIVVRAVNQGRDQRLVGVRRWVPAPAIDRATLENALAPSARQQMRIDGTVRIKAKQRQDSVIGLWGPDPFGVSGAP
jgi:hypothetical protein